MYSYQHLEIWQKSVDLVENIYQLTRRFPDEEKYGLVSQMRRSAISIPSNIAEGKLRGSDKELLRFLRISFGSVGELETQAIIAKRLFPHLSREISDTSSEIKVIIKMLITFMRKIHTDAKFS